MIFLTQNIAQQTRIKFALYILQQFISCKKFISFLYIYQMELLS